MGWRGSGFVRGSRCEQAEGGFGEIGRVGLHLMQNSEAKFLDALYLGVRDRLGFDASLDLLSDVFGVVSTTLIDFDAARPEVSIQASVGIFTGENLRRYHQEFAATDPAPAAFIAQPAGTATPTYRLLPDERRKPGIFFGEFFRPLGMEECLGGTLASTKGRFAMIGLQRSPDRKPFDDADIARLEALMPHLARALQLRRAFLQLERTTGALAGGLRPAGGRHRHARRGGPQPLRQCRRAAHGGRQ